MRSQHLVVPFAVASLVWACPALADMYTWSVSPTIETFEVSAGEAQSTVVPPGRKVQCPNGRVLVSDDWENPPLSNLSANQNIVHWRDLPAPGATAKQG